MTAHIIGNPVPTPEEMGEMLGLSAERVAAVRRIMSTPKPAKAAPGRSGAASRGVRRKKTRQTGKSRRFSVKKG